MTEDEMAQAVAFAEVLGKVKTAHDTSLTHIVLNQAEIKAMMFGLKNLVTKT